MDINNVEFWTRDPGAAGTNARLHRIAVQNLTYARRSFFMIVDTMRFLAKPGIVESWEALES